MATQQLQAKLVTCSVPTKNSAAAQKFYNTLFGGQDFARSLNDKFESYFRPISQDGLTLSIATRSNDREPITPIFAVDNLAATISQLEAVGGKVVVNSTALPVSGPPAAIKTFHDSLTAQKLQPANSLGDWATILDPDGNYIGLIQLEASLQTYFKAEPAHRALTTAQTNDVDNWKHNGASLIK
jgi:predicted enzyme related to lactoylglutathione lyase